MRGLARSEGVIRAGCSPGGSGGRDFSREITGRVGILVRLGDRKLELDNGSGGLGNVATLFDRNSVSDLAEWIGFQFTLCDLLSGTSCPCSSKGPFVSRLAERPSTTSISPEGRNEAGEGNMLDGAVGGDIPEVDSPYLGDATEGREGVDRIPLETRSDGTRPTKYDRGGGGAKGRSSSWPSPR